jgi:hypothetical protein
MIPFHSDISRFSRGTDALFLVHFSLQMRPSERKLSSSKNEKLASANRAGGDSKRSSPATAVTVSSAERSASHSVGLDARNGEQHGFTDG